MEEKEQVSKRPVLRVKNRGGAPKGNSNALKHGLTTAVCRARRADVRARVRHAKAVIAWALAEARAELDASSTHSEDN